MNIKERIIVTNNPSVAKKKYKSYAVDYMEGATPHEVYTAAEKLIDRGGKLTKIVLKDVESYYTTVAVFFDDDPAPLPWNRKQIDAALRATDTTHVFGKDAYRRFIDKRHNAPEDRTSS